MRGEQEFFHPVNLVNPVCFLCEIAEAAKEINADYTRHSLAAREIARQFFEAEKVLHSLLSARGFEKN